MMQLKRVEVKNFKSLENVTVASLRTMNMLYGYNNTGKSNFLRFIELIFRRKIRLGSVKYVDVVPTELRTEEQVGWWEGQFEHPAFMFTDDRRDQLITFAFDIAISHDELGELSDRLYADFLSQDHGISQVRFEGTIRSVTTTLSEISLKRVNINKKKAYDSLEKDGTKRYFPLSKGLKGQSDTLNLFLTLFNDCVLFLDSNRYLTEEKELQELPGLLRAQNAKSWLFNYYIDSQKYADYENFIKFLQAYKSSHLGEDALNARRHWPFSTGDVGFGRSGQSIEVMLRNPKGRLPLSSYGTGVQQIFYLLEKLFFAPACIVLIEEIELNLSPAAQREFFINLQRLLTANHIDQVIFTTHSHYFKYRGDFRIFVAVLDKKGYTSIIRKKTAEVAFFKRDVIS
ncbi:MAG: AAA family ATPase [Thermoplasmata archaeon]|nr:AAA family ATPase [Thermoplasmata archaeon]